MQLGWKLMLVTMKSKENEHVFGYDEIGWKLCWTYQTDDEKNYANLTEIDWNN